MSNLIETRTDKKERALLVHVNFTNPEWQTSLPELQELALSAGAEVVDILTARLDRPHAKFYIGSGKTAALADLVQLHQIDLVIFNHSLTPAQERNVERAVKSRVLDRSGLILDIFAKRAQTHEGKLQVELAQLKYMSTRLVRGWTHLERQRGGGIGLTGPGETQLELDKRMLRERIKQIQKRLEKVRTHRQLSRQARQRSQTPTVALVGYTNAGKSHLFNQLTGENIYSDDRLFATLDPTLRQHHVPQFGSVVLVDTVGFIRDLPHDLVAAFRATLEETVEADLLLHVVDASDPERHQLVVAVNEVLQELDVDQSPLVEVFNKIDVLPEREPRLQRRDNNQISRVYLSAKTGAGLDLLEQTLAEYLSDSIAVGTLILPMTHAKLRAQLFADKCVESEVVTDDGQWQLEVRLAYQELESLCREAHLDINQVFITGYTP